MKDTIHAWDIAGRKLDKPLLIVIDEAAQLQLGWLPTEVSTIAALGAFFVTCWQNLAQINHRYGSLADAALSGHRTKCFFAGIDDLPTTRYLSGLLGHEHVARRGWSSDVPSMWGGQQGGRRSVSESAQREELAPATAVRQMFSGEAVLVRGTLPPVHLAAIRWWEEKGLVALVPTATDGSPLTPVGLNTCPLTDVAAPDKAESAVDLRTLRAALAQLPKPTTEPSKETDGTASGTPSGNPANSEPTKRASARVVRGRCELCGHDLQPGQAREVRRGYRLTIQCSPSCTERHRLGSNGST